MKHFIHKTIQFISAVVVIALLNSCYKSPDLSGLSSDFVVATDVNLDIDFKDYTTYYLSDTIRIVSNNPIHKEDSIMVVGDPELNGSIAARIINKIENNLENRGYQRSQDYDNIAALDYGVIPSIIRITNTGQTCYGWWGGFPGYWPPWGWPPYYPYCTTYAYDTGTVTIEFGDIKNLTNNRLTSMWVANMFGALSTLEEGNVVRTEEAIDQAFIQSPYIQK